MENAWCPPKPCLPQNDPNPREREVKIEGQRVLYEYDHSYPAGVALVKDLPEKEQFSLPFVAKIAAIQFKTLQNSLESGLVRPGGEAKQRLSFLSQQLRVLLRPADLGAVVGQQLTDSQKLVNDDRPTSIGQYNSLYACLERPEIATNFEQDWVFAWQRLAGANPLVFNMAPPKLPDHYGFTDEHCARAFKAQYGNLKRPFTLEAGLKEGRFFVADYSFLNGMTNGSWLGVQKFDFQPIALFAWYPPIDRYPGRFMPIAIQAGQGGDATVFDPSHTVDWMMAKTAVQVADLTWHEAKAHLGQTHLVMEACILAAHRQLGEAHPLMILLEPHFAFTMAINDFAKHHLIAPGGQLDRYIAPALDSFVGLAGKALGEFDWRDVAIKKDFANRGVADTERLPLYPFRDDGIDIWNAIEKWVDEYIDLYYASDFDVDEDFEVRRWCEAMADPKRGALPSIPIARDKRTLKEIVTFFMFTASAQHAALNYTQWPFMGYVPSMPAAVYSDLPKRAQGEEGELPDYDEEYLAMLPSFSNALGQMNLLYLLAGIHYNHLAHYPCNHFQDMRVMPVLRRFKDRLKKVETDSKGRDGNRPMTYPYLFPSNVPQSIHI